MRATTWLWRVGRRARSIERTKCGVRLSVADGEMSRRHFVIRRGIAGWQVADLGSRSGTFVRGHRVGSMLLRGRLAARPSAARASLMLLEGLKNLLYSCP
jgi:pSer/pThr/pTyr-binding forkhead associated (FHA) protein